MKTIVIQSQKGGSGKTTLAAHLAVEVERTGGSAWLIDTDRQATLTHWHERRQADTPQRIDIPVTYKPGTKTPEDIEPERYKQRIKAALQKVAEQGADYCFIDCAPSLSEGNLALLDLADLVLIPVRPSPADLWAVAETVSRVKEAGKVYFFIIMQAKTQASITSQAIAVLSQYGPVVQSFVADRVAYASAMTGGNTAPEEAARGQVAKEIAGLWHLIKATFAENNKSVKEVMHG